MRQQVKIETMEFRAGKAYFKRLKRSVPLSLAEVVNEYNALLDAYEYLESEVEALALELEEVKSVPPCGRKKR